jgi:hypothetical protein
VRFGHGALALCAAIIVAGCGEAQVRPMMPEPGGALQNSASLANREGRSWMLPEAANDDLLYLSDVSTNNVEVFSYPRGRLVGTLTGFGAPRSECADGQGNVWIADTIGFDVIEYPHGGDKPIHALSTPGAPRGCSVDPKTGDLAVTGGINGVILAVYRHGARGGWNDPKKYTDSSIRRAAFCGYDVDGDLFLDGFEKARGGAFRLAELPRHRQELVNIAVTASIAAPGQVQWDGQNVAVGDTGVSPSVIYQFSVAGGSAMQIGSTSLGGTKSVRQFWIAGARVIGPDFNANVGVWKYPAGGSAVKQITKVRGYGAAVSLAANSK